MRLPPEIHKQLYDQARAQLLAGERELESRIQGNPVTLSRWIRARKLLSIVNDVPRVLSALGVTPHEYREADNFWRHMFDASPDTHAIHDLLNERIDVQEEAARIAASPGPTTAAPLEPEAAVVMGADGRLRLVGARLIEGKAQLCAIDLETRAVLWEGAAGAFPWSKLPAFRCLFTLGPRVAIIHEQQAHLVDGQDGRLLWSAPVPYRADLVEQSPPSLFDPSPPGAPGALVLRVMRDQGEVLVGLDRDTGAPRWTYDLGRNGAQILFEVPGVGLAVSITQFSQVPPAPPGPGEVMRVMASPDTSWLGVLDALSGALRWSAPLPFLVHRRKPWIGLFRDMIAAEHFMDGALFLTFLDARTGAPRERVRRVASDPIFAMLDAGAGPIWLGRMGDPFLPSAPLGFGWAVPPSDPWARQRGEKLEKGAIARFDLPPAPCEARLSGGAFILCRPPIYETGIVKAPPTLAAFDAATLALRFELPLGAHSPAAAETLVVLDPRVALADAGPSSYVLRAIDARSGQTAWTAPSEPVTSLRVLGSYLIAQRHDGSLTALRAGDGSIVARWP